MPIAFLLERADPLGTGSFGRTPRGAQRERRFRSFLVIEAVKMDVNPAILRQPLKDRDYPAKKQDLINRAPQEGAGQDVCSVREKLPDNPAFQSVADVNQALGQIL